MLRGKRRSQAATSWRGGAATLKERSEDEVLAAPKIPASVKPKAKKFGLGLAWRDPYLTLWKHDRIYWKWYATKSARENARKKYLRDRHWYVKESKER